MTFSNDLRRFSEKALKRANDVKRAVGIELFTSIILDTPVDTGRARGNWQLSLNEPVDGETARGAAEAVTQAQQPPNYGELTDSNWLTNNLPYIERLEYGYSGQSPEGMVRKNMARVARIIGAEVSKAKK